ncbi:MAG: beta-L-arabinofuranosidase domain-containing protein, partial [Candidatus Thioglobus sp.]
MKRLLLLLFVPLVISCSEEADENVSSKKDSQLMPVAINQVHLEDDFWKTRLKTQGETLVPFALDKTIPAVKNLEKAAKFLKGDTTDLPYPHRYLSSDLYKVMEGAALILMENPNPELEKRIDSIVDIIARAQQEDGYLYVAHTTGVSKNHDAWGGGGMGDKPYSFVLHSHELYNMGHMYEAAVAYYQATGKDKWLKVAEKNAQHINRVFFEGDPNYNNGTPVNQAAGHEEIELALIKLYRVTGNELYLNMSKKFLDIRGKTYIPEGSGVMSPTYSQQHKPVAEQEKAVGHAVRAAYLYSGMADV